MWFRRADGRALRGPLVVCGIAVLLGFVAAPAAVAAEPPIEPAATATMLELGVDAPQTNVPFDVIATVQVVPPATGTPQGTIDLSLDGQPVGSAILGAGGAATFSVEVGEAGSHLLEAQYHGSEAFAPSETESVFAADAPPDPGALQPNRPQLPRVIDRPSSPSTAPPPAPSPVPFVAPAAARPTDLAYTGAFALPGLLLGLSSIGLGLGCRRFARGARRG